MLENNQFLLINFDLFSCSVNPLSLQRIHYYSEFIVRKLFIHSKILRVIEFALPATTEQSGSYHFLVAYSPLYTATNSYSGSPSFVSNFLHTGAPESPSQSAVKIRTSNYNIKVHFKWHIYL